MSRAEAALACHDERMTLVFMTALLLLPVLFWGGAWLAVRHGPFPNRFHRGETWAGFAATVTLIAFLAGFVGPMIFMPKSNMGPLIGLLCTGPAGLVVGLVWGWVRAGR